MVRIDSSFVEQLPTNDVPISEELLDNLADLLDGIRPEEDNLHNPSPYIPIAALVVQAMKVALLAIRIAENNNSVVPGARARDFVVALLHVKDVLRGAAASVDPLLAQFPHEWTAWLEAHYAEGGEGQVLRDAVIGSAEDEDESVHTEDLIYNEGEDEDEEDDMINDEDGDA